MAMDRKGILLVLSGPSGAGKGTICQNLLRQYKDLHYSISATTRAPRTGEEHGVNYFFTSRDNFQEMIEKDQLLEWAEVYGNYYGTPRRYVCEMLEQGNDVVLEIDTQGAMQIKEKFPEGVFVYIVPPSLDELSKRIYKRGTDSVESIKRRLSCASSELIYAQKYNYVVVNDKVEEATGRINHIIIAERYRVSRNLKLIENILKSHCE